MKIHLKFQTLMLNYKNVYLCSNFRKQHEQLYNTIIKVMKAEENSSGSGSFDKSVQLTDSTTSDDVVLAYRKYKRKY
jgi:hypothetical protein